MDATDSSQVQMPVVVMKFGGTSVAEPKLILRCAKRVKEKVQEGNGTGVVVVVSAMGHTTDELVSLAEQVTKQAAPREMDMLLSTGEQVSIALMAMALRELGVEAVSMTGGQMGMLTDGVHTKARVVAIDAERITATLREGKVVVAAGFQGVTKCGEITTLGRGGSDATAVALAAALGVCEERGCCEIYTDVEGVYTADPRLVKNARKLERISYEEMVELASAGAGVMQNRSVLFGQRFGVPIHVRHSQKPMDGTWIIKEREDMEDIVVVGCALKKDLGRVSLRRIPNKPGVQGLILDEVAKANVIVDDIIQTEHGDLASISFTVDHTDLADVKSATGRVLDLIGTGELAVEIGLAKVSVAGVGMRSHTGVAAKMFKALGDAGIEIANITTSEIKISCIVPREQAERSLQVVHDAFELDKPTEMRQSTTQRNEGGVVVTKRAGAGAGSGTKVTI